MVHTPQERIAARQLGERRCLQSQWRLMLCASVLRTAVTRISPAAGASAWWVTLACFLPGLLLYALACMGMRITRTSTLTDCMRRLLGQAGAWLAHGLTAAALLIDGVCSMTAMITLFTQGVGARGTQLTLALVAAGMLLFCLQKEGLPRGIFLLRWVLLAMLLAVIVSMLMQGRADQLFPWLGNGVGSIKAALISGVGMTWPLLLPLLQEPVYARRITAPLPPLALCGLCVLGLNLFLPHELLVAHPALADSMVLTAAHLSAPLRLMVLCLWLGTLFLGIGSAASLAAQQLLAPSGREAAWLAGAAAVLVAATQALDVRSLWQALGCAEPWLLLPLGLCGILAIVACGRKRA